MHSDAAPAGTAKAQARERRLGLGPFASRERGSAVSLSTPPPLRQPAAGPVCMHRGVCLGQLQGRGARRTTQKGKINLALARFERLRRVHGLRGWRAAAGASRRLRPGSPRCRHMHGRWRGKSAMRVARAVPQDLLGLPSDGVCVLQDLPRLARQRPLFLAVCLQSVRLQRAGRQVQGRLRCPPRQRRVHAGRWASTQGREGGKDSFVLIQNVARNRVKSCS